MLSCHLIQSPDLAHCVVIILLLVTRHEQSNQSSQKAASLSSKSFGVQVSGIDLGVHLVHCENTTSQEVLQEELLDLDVFQSACPTSAYEAKS